MAADAIPESEHSSPLLHDGMTQLEGTSPRSLGPQASARSLGSFSYRLPTFPRSVSICQLAGGASEEESAQHKRIQRKLIAALCLAAVFMVVEVVGGIYAHSLAIITDAAHLLSDVSGFAVAALAAYWAKRRSQEHFSYGYHRMEVLGALASVMTVWLVTGILLFEAIQRIITPEPVDGKLMFIIASVGVACNVLMMLILGHHHHGPGGCSHSHGHDHGHERHSHSHNHSHDHGNGGCCDGSGEGSKAAKRQLGPQLEVAAEMSRSNSRACCHRHSHDHGAAAAAQEGVDLEAGEAHEHSHEHEHKHEHGHEHSHGHGHHKHGHHKHEHGHGHKHCHGHEHGHSHSHSDGSEHSHSEDEDEGPGSCSGCTPILAAGHRSSSAGGHAHGGVGGGCSGHSHDHGHSHGHNHGHNHDHANMNVRGAIIHVIGDFVQSIGVCIAGALIWWHQGDPRWYIADPICTFLFAALVLWTTRAILRDISDVLMERVPRGLCIMTINDNMNRVRGVESVHDLHVWSLTPGIPLLCAHVDLSPEADPTAVLHEINLYCRSIGIEHSTLQLVGSGVSCPCEGPCDA